MDSQFKSFLNRLPDKSHKNNSYEDHSSDSDTPYLPLYVDSRINRVWTFFWRWYNTIIFGLVVVALVTIWTGTVALAWKIASEQSRTSCSLAATHFDPSSIPAWGKNGEHGTDQNSGGSHELHYSFSSASSSHADSEKNVGSGSLHIPGFRLAYNASYCDGNRDPDGARARGCIFDPLQTGWIPALCVNMNLTNEFTASQKWEWFHDEARTKPISNEIVLQGLGGKYAFTSDDFHFRHCEYVMKQLIKDHLTQASAVGFKGLDKGHFEHCLDRLINYNTPEIRNGDYERVEWISSAECYERIVPIIL